MPTDHQKFCSENFMYTLCVSVCLYRTEMLHGNEINLNDALKKLRTSEIN